MQCLYNIDTNVVRALQDLAIINGDMRSLYSNIDQATALIRELEDDAKVVIRKWVRETGR